MLCSGKRMVSVKENFLEDVWYQENKSRRKIVSRMLVLAVCLYAFIIFMVKVVLKESIDLSDPSTHKLAIAFAVMGILMIISFLVVVIKSFTMAKNGANLIIPFGGQSREELAQIINTDMREENFLVNEYIGHFKEGDKKYGERVILTQSLLLLVNIKDSGKVAVIPREKIYWLCAQTGIKGRSSYIVRLLIFTESEIFALDGTEVDYVEQLAQKLYEYIPNVFKEYDVFELSYYLEDCFKKNRRAFMALYEEEKQKMLC